MEPVNPPCPSRGLRCQHGFTLIELMITVLIVAILASVALPSYAAYVQRSRVPPALSALSTFQMRMELYFQDTRKYDDGSGNCGVANPTVDGGKFTMSCLLTAGGGFKATATGTGSMSNYMYTIDNLGTRETVSHPATTSPPSGCWSIRGTACDI